MVFSMFFDQNWVLGKKLTDQFQFWPKMRTQTCGLQRQKVNSTIPRIHVWIRGIKVLTLEVCTNTVRLSNYENE